MNRIEMIKKIAQKQKTEARRKAKPNARENLHATRIIRQAEKMESLEYNPSTKKNKYNGN